MKSRLHYPRGALCSLGFICPQLFAPKQNFLDRFEFLDTARRACLQPTVKFRNLRRLINIPMVREILCFRDKSAPFLPPKFNFDKNFWISLAEVSLRRQVNVAIYHPCVQSYYRTFFRSSLLSLIRSTSF